MRVAQFVITAVTVYDRGVLTVEWKVFCLGWRLLLRCCAVKSLCLSGMNRQRQPQEEELCNLTRLGP